MGAMAIGQAAASITNGILESREADKKNQMLSGIQKQMKPIEQQLDKLGQQGVDKAKLIQQQQQSDMDVFNAKVKAVNGEGIADYQEYLHNNGMDSTEDYISKQREIGQRQIDQQQNYQLKSAQEAFKYNSKRQMMENNEELLRVNSAINQRGIKGSSIANQTISQAVSQETQKMTNIAMKFNTSYQDAVSTRTQATQKLTAQLNTEEQNMKTNEFRSMLSWQASQKQEMFQDMTLNLQMHTTKFQREMAELKFQETIQQAKLNDLQTQAETL